MKQLAIIYCGDGGAAKKVAAEMRNGEWNVSIASAYEFNGAMEDCQRVVIMPDVPKWHADRLRASYGSKVDGGMLIGVTVRVNSDETYSTTLCNNADAPEWRVSGDTYQFTLPPLKAKHRGRGKFYVMRGDEIVSGPHTKDEAQRLAA